jgi:hypothetical protein
VRRSDPNIDLGREGAMKTRVANQIDIRRTGSLEQRGSKELLTMLREAEGATKVGRIMVVVEIHGKVASKRTRGVVRQQMEGHRQGACPIRGASRGDRWNHKIR